MTIAKQKIIAYLQNHDINALHLAAELGVHRSALSRWMAGKAVPKPHIQKRINRIIGVRNDWYDPA